MELNQIQNNFESKVSIKIETNSRGYNTTVHVYQGISDVEINDTVAKAVYAHVQLQNVLQNVNQEIEKEKK